LDFKGRHVPFYEGAANGAQPLMNPDIIEYEVKSRQVTTLQLPEFREDLLNIAREAPHGVILNLQNVETLDSAAFGAIIMLVRQLPSPGRVCLFGARRELRTLCEVLRLNNVVGLADTRDEAYSDIENYLARKMHLTARVD
jgi:anti-anti-sigma regulatory factor